MRLVASDEKACDMYAVIRTGGKQYRVQPGDLLVVEKLDGDVGAEIAFDQVLMLGDDGAAHLGTPLVEGAVVRATLIETRKGDKVKIFKKIRRQGYRRTRGHRQIETVLRVTGLEGGGKSVSWDGVVDLTPLSTLRLRARGLAPIADEADALDLPVAAMTSPTLGQTEVEAAVAAEAGVVDEQGAAEAPLEAAVQGEPAAPSKRSRKKADAVVDEQAAAEAAPAAVAEPETVHEGTAAAPSSEPPSAQASAQASGASDAQTPATGAEGDPEL
jgi:large subunit ribosomal protein L21